jgi:hypothetical protein
MLLHTSKEAGVEGKAKKTKYILMSCRKNAGQNEIGFQVANRFSGI